MICAEARRAVLEADLQTLRGSGEDTLAVHLRGCPSCRALAVTILQGEEGLAKELTRQVPAPDMDRIILLASQPDQPARSIGEKKGREPWNARRWRAAVFLPLALAAGLVLLLFPRTPSLPGTEFTPPAPSGAFQVEALEGQTVAVLETGNPAISVVWLF